MESKKRDSESKKKRERVLRRLMLIAPWAFMMIVLISFVWVQGSDLLVSANLEDAKTYSKHYALITGDNDDAFWESVYQSALAAGLESDVYVEHFGYDLAVRYSKTELLDMAINANVDGIILEGDEDEETIALIDRAVEAGIPVVTLLTDSSGSTRQCYVGVNSYDIGQKYGEEIISLIGSQSPDGKTVSVIVNNDADNVGQNLILLGIRERLEKEYGSETIEVTATSIDSEDVFEVEEYMRETFLDKKSLPEFMVCLNSITTNQAYQAAVDYNGVGDCVILGYYDSDSILTAVSKGIITRTLSLDTEEMGQMAVESLNDYIETGYTNGYMVVDMNMINREEAAAILEERGGDAQ
ncbi:MAG: sugar ABC transporter substrate-binding protein [Lachnospiraceae bacterium]|nr:sugar ABC transporter substrate-binding protein [Lachnospiraceae bacterium]